MKAINEFELVDHGIDHPDYFQGCGVAFTSFEDCATGIGSNPAEAIDDCLEMLAQGEWDVDGMERRLLESISRKTFPRRPVAKGEQYYHVSIRVK